MDKRGRSKKTARVKKKTPTLKAMAQDMVNQEIKTPTLTEALETTFLGLCQIYDHMGEQLKVTGALVEMLMKEKSVNPNQQERAMSLVGRLDRITEIIETVDKRCAAGVIANGYKAKTFREMSQDEISEIYANAKGTDKLFEEAMAQSSTVVHQGPNPPPIKMNLVKNKD